MASVEDQKTTLYESEMYDFFLENCRNDLLQILKDEDNAPYFPFVVQYGGFNFSCPKSSDELINSSSKIFSAGDRAATRALSDLYNSVDNREGLTLKRNVHMRIHSKSFPTRCPIYRRRFPDCEDIGNYLALVGTVVRMTKVKSLEFRKLYRCNKCKNTMLHEAPASRYHAFPKTLDKCENRCVGAKVELVKSGIDDDDAASSNLNMNMKDYQEIKLLEQTSLNNFGVMTKSYWVVLEDDLINSCQPGDDVIISGTLFARWKPFRVGKKMEGELCFKANHVTVINDQRSGVALSKNVTKKFENFWKQYEDNPFAGRDIILKSFCPQIYGMYIVKLALSVVIAGGASKLNNEVQIRDESKASNATQIRGESKTSNGTKIQDESKESNGTRIRGESHILLVGDPGTGKSQLLQYVSKLTPRSVLTNGSGTTSAGLTVSAVKDGSEWHLEAGALVLADSGICCIDEFSNMKEHDRVSIHEAMEQQTISVAKAGLISKLNTKCNIIAATNPKLSKYDRSEEIEVNVGLPSPLLSRFDLVMVLTDSQNAVWDELLADFIVRGNNVFEKPLKNARAAGAIWDTETLRNYFIVIKKNTPEMNHNAKRILSAYYQFQRKSENRNIARTTVRLLESLTRLAAGHARLMFRDYVSVHDAITAVSLVEASMQSSSLSSNLPNTLHITFPENPMKEYCEQAATILKLLQLNDIWLAEKDYLQNLLKSKKPDPPSGPSSASTSKANPNHAEPPAQTQEEWFRPEQTNASGYCDEGQKNLPRRVQAIATSTQNKEVSSPPRFLDNTVVSPISTTTSQLPGEILTPCPSKRSDVDVANVQKSSGLLKRKRPCEVTSPPSLNSNSKTHAHVPEPVEENRKFCMAKDSSKRPQNLKRTMDLSRFKRKEED